MVPGRGHLRAAHQGLCGCQRRRHRRLPRPDAAPGPCAVARRQHDLAAAVLSLAAARRRLRRGRLRGRAPVLRHAGRLPRLRRGGPPARPARHHRADRQPHLGPAPVVPGGPTGAEGFARAQLLRLERRPQALQRHAHHLHRHREIELDLRRGGRPVLLAPLLQPPARSQLRQPGGAVRGAEDDGVLARDGRGRLPARRGALPDRARRHLQREPARDARGHQGDPPPRRREVSGPAAAGRGQHVARGRARVLRRRRRVPHGVPLPADAAHVHGHRAGGPAPGGGDPGADARHPGQLPVGGVPAQPRRADARDGDQQGARLHVQHVRLRRAGPHQPGHPPAPGAAAGERPRPHQADEQPAAVDAGHAGAVLRRRDRHGRQHLPRRPRRGAHADAVDQRPQRRLLARRSAAPVPAADPGPDLRLRGGQRRGAVARDPARCWPGPAACWRCAAAARPSAAGAS